MIRALACDIDGTITDEERRLNTEAIQILRRIEEMGVPVVLATGNVLCLTKAASVYIGTSGPVISENGGVIKAPGEKRPRYFCDIERGELKRAFQHLSNELPVRKVDRSDLRKTEIAIYRDFEAEAVRNVLKDYEVRVVDTKFALHIMDLKTSKGSALSEVANMMGIREMDFAALGDSENDYEMLEKSGLGISVGEKKLRNVVEFVTEKSYDRGGVEALKYLAAEIEKQRKV